MILVKHRQQESTVSEPVRQFGSCLSWRSRQARPASGPVFITKPDLTRSRAIYDAYLDRAPTATLGVTAHNPSR